MIIYGYVAKQVNDSELHTMEEVSLGVAPSTLRALAEFIARTADELEGTEEAHFNWHRHIGADLRRQLGCDFIVCRPEEGAPPEITF